MERSLRSLQQMLHRQLAERRTRRYLDFLPDLVMQFNRRVNRMTGMSGEAAEAMEGSEALIIDEFEKRYIKKRPRPVRYPPGTLIRFTRIKSPFHRGYNPLNLSEVFRIVKVDPRFPKVPLYEIESLVGSDRKLLGKW